MILISIVVRLRCRRPSHIGASSSTATKMRAKECCLEDDTDKWLKPTVQIIRSLVYLRVAGGMHGNMIEKGDCVRFNWIVKMPIQL
jgi:hypothetical protein